MSGVRVVAVAPSSPAEKAALKPTTDVIVAVDGHPIDTPEKLAELIGQHAPGDTVKLLVFAGEQFREVAVRSAPRPSGLLKRREPPGRQPPSQRWISTSARRLGVLA